MQWCSCAHQWKRDVYNHPGSEVSNHIRSQNIANNNKIHQTYSHKKNSSLLKTFKTPNLKFIQKSYAENNNNRKIWWHDQNTIFTMIIILTFSSYINILYYYYTFKRSEKKTEKAPDMSTTIKQWYKVLVLCFERNAM